MNMLEDVGDAVLAMHCNTLQHTATRRSTLQHAATRCNTRQHTTCLSYTHEGGGGRWRRGACNALQQTATHCNTRHDLLVRVKVVENVGGVVLVTN